MRTYYLFQIKKECVDYYRENPAALYKILFHLYQLPMRESNYGIQFYEQLCRSFDTGILKTYMEGKYKLNEHHGIFSFSNGNVIQIKPSSCIVRTTSNFPSIFRIFYYYSRDIFVCDFYNKDFFWLTKHYHEIRKPEYNKIGVEKMCNI